MLEVFIEAVFASTLHRVPDKGWAEASEDTTETFSPGNNAPGLEIAFVQLGVDLTAAFDKIEGSDRSVCGTLGVVNWGITLQRSNYTYACQNASDGTCSIVFGRIELNTSDFSLSFGAGLFVFFCGRIAQLEGFVLGRVGSTP